MIHDSIPASIIHHDNLLLVLSKWESQNTLDTSLHPSLWLVVIGNDERYKWRHSECKSTKKK